MRKQRNDSGDNKEKGRGAFLFQFLFEPRPMAALFLFLSSFGGLSRQDGLAEGSRKIEVAPKPRQKPLFSTPTETTIEAAKQQAVKEKCATLQKAGKRIVAST